MGKRVLYVLRLGLPAPRSSTGLQTTGKKATVPPEIFISWPSRVKWHEKTDMVPLVHPGRNGQVSGTHTRCTPMVTLTLSIFPSSNLLHLTRRKLHLGAIPRIFKRNALSGSGTVLSRQMTAFPAGVTDDENRREHQLYIPKIQVKLPIKQHIQQVEYSQPTYPTRLPSQAAPAPSR
jgi:hypothetical protein